MANSRRLRRGVVKQLSNLSIDEVSLVDRGANQHALISIAKRAPQADDAFDDVEKFSLGGVGRVAREVGSTATQHVGGVGHDIRSAGQARLAENKPGGDTLWHVGNAIREHPAAAIGAAAGVTAAGGAAAAGGHHVVHNHFYGGKRAPEETLNVDELFGKKSSFGRGGQQDGTDEFSGDDPAGVLDDENGEDGDVGPGGKIGGVERKKGEDLPPKKKGSKGASSDINPADKAGLGKSANFWKNVVAKALDGEDYESAWEEEEYGKHFPGAPGANPTQSPFPGAAGPGQPPMMQTPGVQPMGMGQPTMPGAGQPMGGAMGGAGGMPSQLPPDVVQYIQQLEQALDQATGQNGDGSDNDDQNDNSTSSDSSSDSSSDPNKKNPFGKSLETSDMDETTFLTELAKSLDDDSEREAIHKALESVHKAEQRAQQAEQIAKAERDLRLEREFIAKAAEFNLPVKSADLGPVLKRAAETLEREDFQTIVKCLRAASASNDYANPFTEVGKRGGGDNADVLTEVEAAAQEYAVSKGLTPEAATVQVLMDNPAAYDEYLRNHPSRRH